MRQAQLFVSILLLVLLLSVCAPETRPAPAALPPAIAAAVAPAQPFKEGPAAPVKAAWEQRWEQTLAAARSEGSVVYHTASGSAVRSALAEGFKKATGITLESVTLRGSEFLPKILAERRAGLYFWDVYAAGAVSVTTILKPAGLLDPLEPELILPELTDLEAIRKTWFESRLRWVDKDRYILMGLLGVGTPIAINTDLVKPGEIKSYRNLLDPKWRGRVILNDPTVGGFPGSSFMPMIVLGGVAGGVEFLRELAKAEPLIMRDQRLQIDWLARGKVAIVIAPESEMPITYIRSGAPVDVVVPEEGTILEGSTGGASVLNRRPHPNTARLFVNWFFSQEGQTIMSKWRGIQSARLDVATDFLHPSRIRQPVVKYYLKEVEENLLRQDEVVKVAKDIFEPLIKAQEVGK